MAPVEVDLSRLPGLDVRIVALLAGRGGGKTTALVEFFSARERVLAIDPVGTLADAVQGRDDVACVRLTPDWAQRKGLMAALIAKLKPAGAKVCVVVPPTSYGECSPFVDALLLELMTQLYAGSLRGVVVLMEECQRYIGQNREGKSTNAIAVIEMGRNWGCGVVMATQRPQSVDKEALARADLYFFGRMSHPLDLGAVDDILQGVIPEKAERWRVLRMLPTCNAGDFLRYEGTIPTVNQ